MPEIEILEPMLCAMLAHAASLDLAHPWYAVKAAMGVMDAAQQMAFMQQLHDKLTELGYDGIGFED